MAVSLVKCTGPEGWSTYIRVKGECREVIVLDGLLDCECIKEWVQEP